jgi:hypothetical protein
MMISFSNLSWTLLLFFALTLCATAEWGGSYDGGSQPSEYRYREHRAGGNTQVAPGSSWHEQQPSSFRFREHWRDPGAQQSRSGALRSNRKESPFRYDPASGQLIPQGSGRGSRSGYIYPEARRVQEGYEATPPDSYRFRDMQERDRQSEEGALRYRPDEQLDELPYMPGQGLPNWFDAAGAPPKFRPMNEPRERVPPKTEPEPENIYSPALPTGDEQWLFRTY